MSIIGRDIQSTAAILFVCHGSYNFGCEIILLLAVNLYTSLASVEERRAGLLFFTMHSPRLQKNAMATNYEYPSRLNLPHRALPTSITPLSRAALHQPQHSHMRTVQRKDFSTFSASLVTPGLFPSDTRLAEMPVGTRGCLRVVP